MKIRPLLNTDLKNIPTPSRRGWSRLGVLAKVTVCGGVVLAVATVITGIARINESPDNINHVTVTETVIKTETAPSAITFQTPTVTDKQHAGEFVDAYAWKTVTVKRRDNLSKIFKRQGLNIADAYAAVQLKNAAPLNKIHPGEKLQFAADENNALAALRYGLDAFTTLHITRHSGRLHAEVETRTPEIRVRGARATIWTNLLDAARSAGLEWETVYELAHLFDWQVDFTRELRKGDQVLVLFEELFLDGEKVANGDIIAAELTVSKRRLHAIRHRDDDGRITYYDSNGDGIQRSFLRSPIKFGRVTSRFSHKRFHPILKKWRAHRGVDYGAPRGTPIRATGDGVVRAVKRNRSYGRTVIIRHGEKYTTLYAHLNRYAAEMKTGKRVRQGEVIGYVGSSGWTTGPHLHYEFRVSGVHHNPLTVPLPKSDPIAAKYLSAFVADAAARVARLQTIGAQHAQTVTDTGDESAVQ